jgi:hypothetical protein
MFDFDQIEAVWGIYFAFQAREKKIKKLFQFSAVTK